MTTVELPWSRPETVDLATRTLALLDECRLKPFERMDPDGGVAEWRLSRDVWRRLAFPDLGGIEYRLWGFSASLDRSLPPDSIELCGWAEDRDL